MILHIHNNAHVESSGCGHGYSSGDGKGYGAGNGYGWGSGDRYGDGYGCGNGYGVANGDGHSCADDVIPPCVSQMYLLAAMVNRGTLIPNVQELTKEKDDEREENQGAA